MGQTGEGIEKEEDIHPGTAFTTKWDKIKKEFPWFFHVRSLIGERPNLMPTGLGNNESEVDLSLLLTSDRDGDDTSSFAPDDTTEGPGSPTGSTAPVVVVDVDDDSDSDLPPPALLAAPSTIRKRKPSESGVDTVKPEKKKTKPSPGVSQPAPTKTLPPSQLPPKTSLRRWQSQRSRRHSSRSRSDNPRLQHGRRSS
ncbi:hypothetical protein B0H14DRAFT_2863963, partial [Mycena olivaceomarginata]